MGSNFSSLFLVFSGGPQCKDSKPVVCGAVRCGDIPQVIYSDLNANVLQKRILLFFSKNVLKHP